MHHPEIWQALSDVLASAGRTGEAAGWHDRTLASHLAETSVSAFEAQEKALAGDARDAHLLYDAALI